MELQLTHEEALDLFSKALGIPVTNCSINDNLVLGSLYLVNAGENGDTLPILRKINTGLTLNDQNLFGTDLSTLLCPPIVLPRAISRPMTLLQSRSLLRDIPQALAYVSWLTPEDRAGYALSQ